VRSAFPSLPASEAERLRRQADAIVIAAMATEFFPNLLLPESLSTTTSVLGSVVKRHGYLIAEAFMAGLTSSTALDIAVTDIPRLITFAGTRQVDTLVFDRRTGRLTVIEVKRGGGQQPSSARRDQESRLAAIVKALRPVARAWLHDLGVTAPKRLRLEAVILAYYGQYGATSVPVICRPDIHARFGAHVVGIIDLVTEYLRRRLLLACAPAYARGLIEAEELLGSSFG
jgi:hypothetical protein